MEPLIQKGSCGQDENPKMKDQMTKDESGLELGGKILDLEANVEDC